MLNKSALFFVGLVGMLSLYNSSYYLKDTECAVQIRSNRFLKNNPKSALLKPGIHFKAPFIDTIIRWDNRVQCTHLHSMPLIIKDDVTIRLECQCIWRIKEPMRYATYQKKKAFESKTFLLKQFNEYLEKNAQHQPLSFFVNHSSDALKAFFIEKGDKIGIEIVDCCIIQKAPSFESKKIILAKMKEKQLKAVDLTIQHSKNQVLSIEMESKADQAKQLSKAKAKAAVIQKEGEVTAMDLYSEAYRKNLKFAEIYQRITAQNNHLDAKNGQFMIVQMNAPLSEEVGA